MCSVTVEARAVLTGATESGSAEVSVMLLVLILRYLSSLDFTTLPF